MTTPVPSILSRRRLLQLSALGGAGLALGPVLGSSRVLATAGSSPAPSTPVDLRTLNVQLGWIANVENAGEFVADEKGYYAEEGLDLDARPGRTRLSPSNRPSCPARRWSASPTPTRSPAPAPRAPS